MQGTSSEPLNSMRSQPETRQDAQTIGRDGSSVLIVTRRAYMTDDVKSCLKRDEAPHAGEIDHSYSGGT
jgi:hypothetical protein